jgi:hypothetical protein
VVFEGWDHDSCSSTRQYDRVSRTVTFSSDLDKKQRAGEPYYSNGAMWRPYAVGCDFVLLAAGAFLAVGLLTLLAGCACFWSFLPADTLADAGFSCAVLA